MDFDNILGGVVNATSNLGKGLWDLNKEVGDYGIGLLGDVVSTIPTSGEDLEQMGQDILNVPIRAVNWGVNLVEGAGGGVFLFGKEILYDGVVLRSLGKNGTPMWHYMPLKGMFEFVQEDILRDFVGMNFTDEESVPEHTLFGPKGLGSGIIGVVPEEIRGVIRDPIHDLGKSWGYAINQLVDNPLSMALTMQATSGVSANPTEMVTNIAKGKFRPQALIDPDEWKQAHDVVYRGDRSMGQSLAVYIAGIDPFDEDAYNSIESQWWFDMISGTADFAKEIFLDPVERFTLGATKVARGATTIARINDAGDVVKLYRFGISDDFIRTATPSKVVILGPKSGIKGIEVFRNKDFAVGKDLTKPNLNLPVSPNPDAMYKRNLGIKSSITELQAKGAADSKWFKETYQTLVDDIPSEGGSFSLKHFGLSRGKADNLIKDQRASLFLKAVGRKFIKTVPDDVAYAIGSSASLPAAQRVLRNYMGDLSVKVEIDSIVRQADDMVDGSWKVDLEELNNLEREILRRKELVKTQKNKLAMLKTRLAQKEGSQSPLVRLQNERIKIEEDIVAESTKVYEVPLNKRLRREGEEVETAAKAQSRMRKNAKQRLRDRRKKIDEKIESLIETTKDDVKKLEGNVKDNEIYIRENEVHVELESYRLLKEGEIFSEVNWEHHFDFDTIVRQAQQKKYTLDNAGGHVADIDPLDVLSPTDNFHLNVLIDGIAEGIVNGSSVLARTGNGKIHRPLNFIHKQNMKKLAADRSREISVQKHWIPSTFEPAGFRALRFITQRVPQGLIHFDDLGGQSYIMYERMLESAANQSFDGLKIINVDEVEQLLGEWRRLVNEGADFVEMGKLYQKTTKKLNKRAEKIFIEKKIKVYDAGSNQKQLIKEGDLDAWLDEAREGFINRVNPKNGVVRSLKRKVSKTVTADADYLADKGNRLRGRLTEEDLQPILDEYGEEAVSMILTNDSGIDVLFFNMSPSQMSASAVVPRWDILGNEFRRATGDSMRGLTKPSLKVARQIASGGYGAIRNVWTAGKLLTPRWTARVITDEKLRMAAVFGMMNMFGTLQNGLASYRQALAGNGLNWSEGGFENALREEWRARYGDNIWVGDNFYSARVGTDEWGDRVYSAKYAPTGKAGVDPTTGLIRSKGAPSSGELIPIEQADIVTIILEAQRLGRAWAPEFGYKFDTDITAGGGQYHFQAPDEGASIADMSGIFRPASGVELTPEILVDLYGNQGIGQWALDGRARKFDAINKEMIEVFKATQGNPDAIVTVWRAIPSPLGETDVVFKVNEFDWVTPSKKYAEMFGEWAIEGEYKLAKLDIKASELIINRNRKSDVGEIYEYGYVPTKSPQYEDFVEKAIQRNIDMQKKKVGKFKYGGIKAASTVGRVLAGSAVSPLVGLAWAGRHWQSRTKAIQQLSEKTAAVNLAQAYTDEAFRLLDESTEATSFSARYELTKETPYEKWDETFARHEEFKRLAKEIAARGERVNEAFKSLEKEMGFAIKDRDKIVSLFDRAAVEWDNAGFPRLEVGNKTFQNAYGSDQRWHRMVTEQLSSRRSTDGAVRGFFHAEKRMIEEQMPQQWNVYDLVTDGKSPTSVEAWNTHYKQFSPTGPISKDLYDVIYNDTLTDVQKVDAIASVIDGNSTIRERLGINKYEGLEGDKEILKLIARDIIDETNDLLPPTFLGFEKLRARARQGDEITWDDVENTLMGDFRSIRPNIKTTKEAILLIREQGYEGFGKGRGPAWMATDQSAIIKMSREAMDRGFAALGTTASDTISRQPFFQAAYARNIIETIEPYRKADGTYEITPLDVTRIEKEARKQALAETREILYELAERTQFAEAVGFAMPFFNAYQEVIGRWAGLALENPQFIGKGIYFWSKDNYELPLIGINQEENEYGNKVMVFRPANSDLAKLFSSKPFKAIAGFNANIMPSKGPVGDVLASTGINLDRDGLLSMIQQTTPSFGPFITVPIREVMMGTGPLGAKPELEELFGWLYPFGHPDGNLEERLLQELAPTWAKHLWYSTGWGIGNTQIWDRTVLQQVAMLDAQMRQNGITPDYTNRSVIQDIVHEAQTRARNIGILKVFGSTLVPVAVDDASPFVEMIKRYRALQELERQGGPESEGLADQLFFAQFGEEFFMLTGNQSNNNLNIDQSVSAWLLSKEFGGFLERHPVLAPALTKSLGGSILEDTEYSPIVRQMMLNDENIEYLNPEQFIEKTEVRQGWAEWNEWLDTPNQSFADPESGEDPPTPNDVRYNRSGVTSSFESEINADLKLLFESKEAELALKYPLWGEAREEYTKPTYLRDVMKGIEELLDNPSMGKKYEWWTDLVGEDGYLEERKAIQEQLEANAFTGGSSDITAEENAIILLRWAKELEEFATRPKFSAFFERYFANDLVTEDSWMD